MSFFSDIRAKLSLVVDSVRDKVVAFAQYFLPKAEALVEVALEDLLTLATNAVLAEAPKVISGQEKFASAVNTVVSQLKVAGQSAANNTVNAAVQLAYLEIQRQVSKK